MYKLKSSLDLISFHSKDIIDVSAKFIIISPEVYSGYH